LNLESEKIDTFQAKSEILEKVETKSSKRTVLDKKRVLDYLDEDDLDDLSDIGREFGVTINCRKDDR